MNSLIIAAMLALPAAILIGCLLPAPQAPELETINDLYRKYGENEYE